MGNLDTTERPLQYLASQLQVLGFDADSSVAMMTGADVSAAAYELQTHQELQVAAWTTAGCSNALSVGDSATVERTSPATINIIVAVNQPLSRNALVEAVQIATEARVLAVQKAGVKSVVSGNLATGTGTDCIVVAAPSGDPIHQYCGKHTRLGELIGKAVLTSCLSAIRT